jgi:hypothetical protein
MTWLVDGGRWLVVGGWWSPAAYFLKREAPYMLFKRGLCFAVAVFVVLVASSNARQDVKPIRVLFIGNSYTFVNDLPGMIAELAKAGKQPPLEFAQETPGGCTFEKHWNDGKAAVKIKQKSWDYVVLQEQSQRPLSDPKNMFEFAGKLNGEIQAQRAKTILYQTWSRQDAPDKQDALSKAYLDLGTELKAEVAPVGMAWQKALRLNPMLVLHSTDKSHPNKSGTYLAACVFYGTLYGKSPVGLPGSIASLDNDQAKVLQEIAWETVKQKGK